MPLYDTAFVVILKTCERIETSSLKYSTFFSFSTIFAGVLFSM